ncbi:MAG: T9SS type A sorting domain-containing protein [Chitinophagales bacterium]|nr:T9SS type A sorting domain-containing protein [Chitinophagales bacterium]MDW8427384.1 T9SS type A sorting domain-containing protein [Chitinophagales bacterium]
MIRLFIWICALMAGSVVLWAQQSFRVPLGATWTDQLGGEDWFPSLVRYQQINDEAGSSDALTMLKAEAERRWPLRDKFLAEPRNTLDSLYVWKGFQGNVMGNSVPNDNDIAVSTTGYLISVMNTSIFRYDLNKDSALGSISLHYFASPLGINAAKYDPKVIYDPIANRFIIAFLAGFQSDNTHIILAFSSSDHPNDPWYLYRLPGNPLNDGLWSDFPMFALTEHELFFTINHLMDDSSWQTGWRRTVIWQIRKADGYAGDTLLAVLHDTIQYQGRLIRNLCPVKGSTGFYGREMYFLSQRNMDVVNDTFFLVRITDTIGSPQMQLQVWAIKSPSSYFFPVNAVQPHVTKLATNDSRVLGAVYHAGTIQFVGNTTDTATGRSAFYHGVLRGVPDSMELDFRIIGHSDLSFGYPNLAYVGDGSPDDQRCVIIVLRSSSTVFPGFSVMLTDGQGQYSALTSVINGQSYHYVIAGTQRWGDYTGAQRNYVTGDRVWVNGSFATISHKINTWIADIGLEPPASGVPASAAAQTQIKILPNPAHELLNVWVELDRPQRAAFELVSADGRFYRLLLDEYLRPGRNEFSCSVRPLPAGTYILRIRTQHQVLAEKLIVK